MKKLLVLLLALPLCAESPQYLYSQDAKSFRLVSATIPAAYSSSNPNSLVISNVSNMGNLCIFTTCTGDIAVAVTSSLSPSADSFYVPAANGQCTDNVPIHANVFIKSDTGVAQTCNVKGWIH